MIAGFAGNICVLFTANDAHMREYKIVVPSDCIASNTSKENDWALMQMATVLKADVDASPEIIKKFKSR
jgi:nicotinamidase-related amidase